MIKYRTDLAIECREMLGKASEGTDKREDEDISVENIVYGEDVKATRIRILNKQGAERMGKPEGCYITIEAGGVLEERDGVKDMTEKAIASELGELIKDGENLPRLLKFMVVGLGNDTVTPDALGPRTASKIRVTGHIFELLGMEAEEGISNVSCITPGVIATTGMETADIIKKAAEISKPDIIIAVDSLAARNIERLSTTIQLTDTGISPGGGMGNRRKWINKETAGAMVIAVGVPTVIDASTIIRDAFESNDEDVQKVEKYIEEYGRQMIVTSTDIDMIIKDFSDIIANGINKTVHPGIYS